MQPQKSQVKATLLQNTRIKGDYFCAELLMEAIPQNALPGQFIHVQIPDLNHRVLRRPFSIFNVEEKRLSLLYKVVGEGTKQLSYTSPGKELDIVGPLGRPFSPLPEKSIIVAGGYGCAATYLLAKNAPVKPMVLIGGRTKEDILLKEEYEALGCEVRISTDDGSTGFHGRVTQLLQQVIAGQTWLAACGPIPMLKALAELMPTLNLKGELSLDKAMCCGVGACFACVAKVKDATSPDGWRYARVCAEGPVFKAEELIFA
ncbi:MAG: dihydroorotate dehydrogenase electron transfer subunit [Victivallales bacterium]|nr:dihydroorotate dehydrogenase electron transfer subunit [Victivallales bacterium]